MFGCTAHLLVSLPLVALIISASTAKAQSCAPPSTTNSVSICKPQNSQTVDGAVEVSAAVNVTGLTLVRVSDNNMPLYETPMTSFDTFLYLGSGVHHISVVAFSNTGEAFRGDTNFTVTNGSAGRPCGVPTTDGTITFCYPTAGRTVGSPVTISAAAKWNAGGSLIAHVRLYMDDKAVFDSDGQTIFTRLSLPTGTHKMAVVAWNSKNQFITNSATFKVVSTSCSPTGAVSFCWPMNNDTIPTTIQITAASSLPNLTLLRLYDNDQKIFETTSTSLNKIQSVGQGLHHLVVVAYDSSGNTATDQRSIRVVNIGVKPACGIPESTRDINICSPGEWQALPVASPVIVSARARWDGQVINHIRVYMDHQDVFDADSQNSVYQQFTLSAGQHYMVVTVWNNHGDHTTVARTFRVQ